MKTIRIHRTVRAFTVAAAAACLIAGVGTGAAQADTGNIISYGTQAHWITASYDGLNVAVADGATWAGARIIQWYNDGAAEQKWYFDQVYDNEGGFEGYLLRNENSGMCLYEDGYAGDELYQEPCDPNDGAELFWHYGQTGGDNSFESRHNNLYMDVSGVSYNAGDVIDGWYGNNGINQNFWVTNVSS